MIIEISDSDGIISLVNADKYKTFVDENWTLEQLKQHFIQEMNSNSIIVWQTNNYGGGHWIVKFTLDESNEIAHSEFTKSIEVTNGKLYLADYTDLTMAAQFEKYEIPAKENKKQYFEVENGIYNIKIKRLFDPEEEFKDDKIGFEIILMKAKTSNVNQTDDVYWWTFE